MEKLTKETNPLLHLPAFVDALIEKIEKDQEEHFLPMPTTDTDELIFAIKTWMDSKPEKIDWVWISYLAMLGWLLNDYRGDKDE